MNKASDQALIEKYCKLGRTVIQTEQQAIHTLLSRLDNQFAMACDYLLHCQGRIIVMGMGKSGHIGNKIAATLASTGSPAFFVHAGEASHGDMGMITKDDIVIAISYSGKTPELVTLLPVLKRLGTPVIALAGNPQSELATVADIFLDVSVNEEACPLGLAPTSSTTATLVMGDALAITLLQTRGFTAEDFARSHPGGSLGKRLLLRVSDIMRQGSDIPSVTTKASVSEALVEMSAKTLGMTAVVDKNRQLKGVFTDGDLRRAMDASIDVHNTLISDVMTTDCKTIDADTLAATALNTMEKYQITTLMVTDDKRTPTGVLHLHDLLKAGVI